MIRYYDQKTGKRVSKETWQRSKAHGGSRYVRRGSKASKKIEGTARSSEDSRAVASGSTSSKEPRTFAEWQVEAKKRFKKKGRDYDDFDYDNGIEYETGVDY